MFAVQRPQFPPSSYECLATNVIESPQSGVQKRLRNVTRWQDAYKVERWVASAWLLTEKHLRNVVSNRNRLGSRRRLRKRTQNRRLLVRRWRNTKLGRSLPLTGCRIPSIYNFTSK